MGRSCSGRGPGRFHGVNLINASQTLADEQSLERIEPVAVVGVAEVGVTLGLCARDGQAQGGGPFVPAEDAALMQAEHEREGLGLPGRGEDGALLVAWQAGQGRQAQR